MASHLDFGLWTAELGQYMQLLEHPDAGSMYCCEWGGVAFGL